ncbi:MAG: glycosyltransferase [Actinomycetota bacterium]|nr:glycosyltransferase [Actinomycetota bacterium]
MTSLCFVTASAGNHFMKELLAAVASEASALGAAVTHVADHFPDPYPDTAYVYVPHEYAALAPADGMPTHVQRSRSIALCTEQPGTTWFDLSAAHAAAAGAVLDISDAGEAALRRRGVRAERFRLGYAECWDVYGGQEGTARDVDILFMGSSTPRRQAVLAANAATLARHRCRILLAPERPKPHPREDYVVDDQKRALLARSSVMLNIHRGELRYFEWVRAIEAICAGTVLVSEPSDGCQPLIPGEHLGLGEPEDLGHLASWLLQEPERLTAIRSSAYDFVRAELPMRPAVERLLTIADGLPRRRGIRHGAAPASSPVVPPPDDADEPSPNPLQRSFKHLLLRQIHLERAVSEIKEMQSGRDPDAVETAHLTPAYPSFRPRVSVCIPVRNHAEEIIGALDSVVGAEGPPLEILVLDDCSTDRTLDAAVEWMQARAHVIGSVMTRPVNRGLGAGRNELLRTARGEYAFMLDADNSIYPAAIARLCEALDGDPGAAFAYCMLERHSSGRSLGLLSDGPWEPDRLRDGNYVDAMALLRRVPVLELGGYSEDIRLYGWEDFDLWCRIAQRGGHGVFVPEILCRYRQSHHSMLSVTGIDGTEAISLMRERYPSVWPGERRVSVTASPGAPDADLGPLPRRRSA